MDISYKTIIEFLCSAAEAENTFPSKRSIMVSSENFPKKFADIFESTDKINRFGVTREVNGKNISFLSSFLSLIDNKIMYADKKEEINIIMSFIDSLKEKIKSKQFKFELDMKFNKQIILDRINIFDFSDGILPQVIAQIFDINFLIFDFDNENIYTLFNGDYLNPWKATFLLAKKENNWEPLFSDKKSFCFNDSFLRTILTENEIMYFNDSFLEKYYTLLDNIKELENINSSTELEESEDDTFINPVNEIKKMNLNKSKLKNMKKDNLVEIVSKLNLNISVSSNKTDMINKILPYV